MSMNKVIGFAIIAAGVLGGCTYEPPSPYAYFPVPCAPATATPSPSATVTPAPSATVTPAPPGTVSPGSAAAPNSPAGPVETTAGSGQCVAVVPTYTYPAYYPYPGYYYPGYYGPPVYGSVFVGGRFR
jgi:hypothetical protein